MTATPITVLPLTVRYHECDPQGVVFNAHYLAYADLANFACVDVLFGSYDAMLATGIDVVVAEANVRYYAPCRFGEQLHIYSYVDRIGTTSFALTYDLRRDNDQIAEVHIRYVWVDTDTYRPTRPPGDVADAFAAYLPT